MATHVGTDCVSPGNITTISIPWPAGAAVGDQAILLVATSTGTTSITDTDLASWTSLVRAGSAFYVHVYAKTLTAAESGSLALTLTTQNRASGAIVLLRGADPITSADVAWTATTDPPSITRTGTRVGVCAIAERASSGLTTAYTAPSGWTLADASYLTGTGATNLAVAHLMTDDPDGTIDPAAWGRNGTTTTYIAVTVAVPIPASATSVTSTCSTTWATSTLVRDMTWPHIAAHRGGNPGPEETMVAYAASGALSQAISAEGDMHVLSDGTTIALCHDDTIDRTVSTLSPITTGTVASFTPGQWATILMRNDIGSGNHDDTAGTLAQLAAAYGPAGTAGYRRLLLLERKGGAVAPQLAALAAAGLAGQTIVQSFTWADCTAAVAAGFDALYLSDAPNVTTVAAAGVRHIGLSTAAITAQLCTDAHAAGLRVWAYTVNTASARDTYLALGVDAFFTDEPATLLGTTQVTSAAATTWAVRQTASSATGTAWAVRQGITTTTATAWATRAAVTATAATSWATRSAATSTTATTWPVRARTTTTASAAYPVRATVTSTTATAWPARSTITSTTSTPWAARATVTSTTATAWQVLTIPAPGTVTSTCSTTWATRAAATSTTTAAYPIRAMVTATTTTVYAVRGRATTTAATSWAARTTTTSTTASQWSARQLVTAAALAVWAVRARVTATAAAAWLVQSDAGRDVTMLTGPHETARQVTITEHQRGVVILGSARTVTLQEVP